MNIALRASAGWLRANLDWLLVLSVVPLLATKTLFNLPIAVMAILGGVRLWRAPRRYLDDPAFRLLGALFLALWIPMLLSLPDAVNPRRALGTALIWLRFPLAAVFVLDVLARAEARRRLLAGTALIVLAWSADALVQHLVGRNLLGYPPQGTRITGIFHPKLVLGVVTAAFLFPVLAWLQAHGRGRRRLWLWGLAALPVAAVALGGNRSGWIMLLVGGVFYAALQVRRLGARRLAVGALSGAALLAAVFAAVSSDGRAATGQRLAVMAGLLSLDWNRWDEATGLRAGIWATAANVARAHWLNGVGPRGFRHEARRHRHPRDRLTSPTPGGMVPTHPHLFLLEVAAETGLFGLLGLLAFWLALGRHLLGRLRAGATPAEAGWLAAAVAAAFPLNAHLALYASYWSTVLWWLLVVGVAAGACRPRRARA